MLSRHALLVWRRLLPIGLALLCPAATPRLRADYPLPPQAVGDLYVSSYGTDEVAVFAREGGLRFRFGHQDLDGPRGLAFAPSGELYCASQLSDRVLVFTAEGRYLRQFSVPELDGPTSLAFDAEGRLWVASFETDELLIFGGESLERRVAVPGLNGPNCIAFGPRDEVWVASQLTNEVYRLDSSGAFVDSFRGEGLSSPMGVAWFEDRLYVTGGASHTVTVFDAEGNFIENLSTRPEIISPQGIAFDPDGSYVLASFSNGHVARFRQNGLALEGFDPAELRVARSVAFRPLSPEELPFIRGDFNRDERLDLSDPVAILGLLFLEGRRQDCLDAADTNDSGRVDISDAVYGLNFLFNGGPQPPRPFPEPGEDATADDLDCRA